MYTEQSKPADQLIFLSYTVKSTEPALTVFLSSGGDGDDNSSISSTMKARHAVMSRCRFELGVSDVKSSVRSVATKGPQS